MIRAISGENDVLEEFIPIAGELLEKGGGNLGIHPFRILNSHVLKR